MAVSDIPVSKILNSQTSYDQLLYYIPVRDAYRWDHRTRYMKSLGYTPVTGQVVPATPPAFSTAQYAELKTIQQQDTGLRNITSLFDFTYITPSSHPFTLRRKGDTVHLQMMYAQTWNSGNNIAVMTLPVGFRPVNIEEGSPAWMQSRPTSAPYLAVLKTGAVMLSNYPSTGGTAAASKSKISFLTDDTFPTVAIGLAIP